MESSCPGSGRLILTSKFYVDKSSLDTILEGLNLFSGSLEELIIEGHYEVEAYKDCQGTQNVPHVVAVIGEGWNDAWLVQIP